METEKKKTVSEIVSEMPVPLKIGLFSFKLRQPTLSQIYEMGAVANDIEVGDLAEKMAKKEKVIIITEAITHYKDAALMREIFLILLFRSKWKRRLWKRYILKRLTVGLFHSMVGIVNTTFNLNFFLTSIIFLKQATKITEPSQTTAPGQSSEG